MLCKAFATVGSMSFCGMAFRCFQRAKHAAGPLDIIRLVDADDKGSILTLRPLSCELRGCMAVSLLLDAIVDLDGYI